MSLIARIVQRYNRLSGRVKDNIVSAVYYVLLIFQDNNTLWLNIIWIIENR